MHSWKNVVLGGAVLAGALSVHSETAGDVWLDALRAQGRVATVARLAKGEILAFHPPGALEPVFIRLSPEAPRATVLLWSVAYDGQDRRRAESVEALFADAAELRSTVHELRQLCLALETFYVDTAGYPLMLIQPKDAAGSIGPVIGTYYRAYASLYYDGWGTLLRYTPAEEAVVRPWGGGKFVAFAKSYRLESAGPDRKLGTDDDLVFVGLRGGVPEQPDLPGLAFGNQQTEQRHAE